MENSTHNCANCTLKSKCFEALNPAELELISAHRVELQYRKGENIAKQGAFVHHLLFLQKGLVKVYMELQNDSDLILNLFSGGQLIGLPNLFSQVPLQYSVAAIGDSSICAIDIRIIEELISSNGDFAKAIIHEINHCTHYYFQRILTSSQKQLSGRMADALLHLAQNVFKSNEFPMLLSRKELSEFAGMSTMSAVRVIKDLEANKVIAEKNNILYILDMTKLLQLSKTG
jgi:CRP-like cAMP-binding protein